MRYRRLGADGPEVSVVGLGCNNFGSRLDEAGTRAVVHAALDVGVTLFDTADVYGNFGDSERFLGAALRGRRDGVVIATKFAGTAGRTDLPAARGSRPYVRRSLKGSLERLGTDWIDLYQYHYPDGVTPLEETLAALDELVEEGTVRFIGSSNFSPAEVEEAERIARERGWARLVSEQSEYSLLRRDAEAELLPTCERLGVGFLPFFPLASGFLTGKYRRGQPFPAESRYAGREETVPAEAFDVVEAVERYAAER
nr:aldo/keto reductase [Actinomycetota bacterium]